MNQLFADGGVIRKNPSIFGGTFAYRIVQDGEVILEHSGIIRPAAARVPKITNNQAEMCAVVAGLLALQPDWIGTVYSDSSITLGRVFEGYRWGGIPQWLHVKFRAARLRLVNWMAIDHVLLSGHPTKAQLVIGLGKGGRQVSEHQVWCDLACKKVAKEFLAYNILS